MRSERVKKGYDLPSVGSILSGNQEVPVNHKLKDGLSRWNTFAIYNDGWELSWSPKRGLVVFFDKKDYDELEVHPWCQKVKVTRHIGNTILVEKYE